MLSQSTVYPNKSWRKCINSDVPVINSKLSLSMTSCRALVREVVVDLIISFLCFSDFVITGLLVIAEPIRINCLKP